MVSGTLLHVGTKGPEDKHLYGNPKMTFFKNVFVNFILPVDFPLKQYPEAPLPL